MCFSKKEEVPSCGEFNSSNVRLLNLISKILDFNNSLEISEMYFQSGETGILKRYGAVFESDECTFSDKKLIVQKDMFPDICHYQYSSEIYFSIWKNESGICKSCNCGCGAKTIYSIGFGVKESVFKSHNNSFLAPLINCGSVSVDKRRGYVFLTAKKENLPENYRCLIR